MADIELVIRITKEMYKAITGGMWCGNETIGKAIANGTVLPKGYGDLKDMDDIYEALEGWDDNTSWIVDAIDRQASTIIEADKLESEDKE